MKAFTHQEMVYPKAALAEGMEGTVVLLFVVTKEGATRDMRVWQSVSPELDQETIRLFNLLEWNPAIWDNVTYDSEHYFRVQYNIRKYQKLCRKRGYNTIAYPYQPIDSTFSLYALNEVDDSPTILFSDTSMTWEKYVKKNLRYPDEAFRNDIQGSTIIRFIVEPHGRVTNFDIEKELGAGCSLEAIRLIRALRFLPGIKDGKAVRTRVEFVVHFVLPSEEVIRNQGTLHQ